LIVALDGFIAEFEGRLGIERCCRLFGTPVRSYRHRRARRSRAAPGDATARAAMGAGDDPGARSEPVTAVVGGDGPGAGAGDPTVDPAPAAAVMPPGARSVPAPHPAALSRQERYQVLELLCSERFVDLSPRQVFMTLLDEGTYLCSVRSMYRLLAEHGLAGERRRGGHQQPGYYPIPVIEASRPNEAWSWDITKLRGPAKGVLYYLYTILDIFSRKVVGWTIALSESAAIAEELIARTITREGITKNQLTLHADRGGPMIAGGVSELLSSLGVHKSHSRPRVSNDNPYVESSFKTLKFRPDYPERFDDINHARAWCRTFFSWYNHTHYHSGIAYLRPADVHAGRHPDILQQRQHTLDQARAKHPERFRTRPTAAEPPQRAWINRPSIQTS
jgi:putative transposase